MLSRYTEEAAVVYCSQAVYRQSVYIRDLLKDLNLDMFLLLKQRHSPHNVEELPRKWEQLTETQMSQRKGFYIWHWAIPQSNDVPIHSRWTRPASWQVLPMHWELLVRLSSALFLYWNRQQRIIKHTCEALNNKNKFWTNRIPRREIKITPREIRDNAEKRKT